jgi:hypothetical protein
MKPDVLELQEHLSRLDYPVSKEDLVRWAQEVGLDTATLHMLRSLPADEFRSPGDVGEAILRLP